MSMVNLNRVDAILDEARDLIHNLHGVDLDETNALTTQSKGDARRQRAQHSSDLRLLADRLELAAALVRNEYWASRGEKDFINDRNWRTT